MRIDGPTYKMIKIYNNMIPDYRQFDSYDTMYTIYKRNELRLLRRRARNMITKYKKIKLHGKRIVDYRQFPQSNNLYRCYRDIENDLINQHEISTNQNEVVASEIDRFYNINIPYYTNESIQNESILNESILNESILNESILNESILNEYESIPPDESILSYDGMLPSYYELYNSPPSYEFTDLPPLYTQSHKSNNRVYKFFKAIFRIN